MCRRSKETFQKIIEVVPMGKTNPREGRVRRERETSGSVRESTMISST
jgi:hypothetical protein